MPIEGGYASASAARLLKSRYPYLCEEASLLKCVRVSRRDDAQAFDWGGGWPGEGSDVKDIGLEVGEGEGENMNGQEDLDWLLAKYQLDLHRQFYFRKGGAGRRDGGTGNGITIQERAGRPRGRRELNAFSHTTAYSDGEEEDGEDHVCVRGRGTGGAKRFCMSHDFGCLLSPESMAKNEISWAEGNVPGVGTSSGNLGDRDTADLNVAEEENEVVDQVLDCSAGSGEDESEGSAHSDWSVADSGRTHRRDCGSSGEEGVGVEEEGVEADLVDLQPFVQTRQSQEYFNNSLGSSNRQNRRAIAGVGKSGEAQKRRRVDSSHGGMCSVTGHSGKESEPVGSGGDHRDTSVTAWSYVNSFLAGNSMTEIYEV